MALTAIAAVRRRLYRARRRIWLPGPEDRLWFALRFGWKRQIHIRTARADFHLWTTSRTAKQHFFPYYQSRLLYETPVVALLEKLCAPDTFFLDIGANVGYYTLLAAQVCGRVAAFEVDPALVAELERNVQLNGVGNVQIVCAAVWSGEGQVFGFAARKHNKSMNALCPPENGSVFAPGLSIDTFCAQSGGAWPDVAKIDVEGAEGHVLRGMARALHSIRVLFVELHPDALPAFGDSVQSVLDLLCAHDFEIRLIPEHRDLTAPEPLPPAEMIRRNCMLYATRGAP